MRFVLLNKFYIKPKAVPDLDLCRINSQCTFIKYKYLDFYFFIYSNMPICKVCFYSINLTIKIYNDDSIY